MVDKKDLLIVSYVRMNARETLTRISKKTKVPVSTVYERIKKKEASIIVRHTSLLDFRKLGFMTRAQVLIKAKQGERQKVQDFLSKHHHVNNLTKINNGYDYLVEVVFRHVQDLECFIEKLEDRFKIKKQVHYVLSDIAREKFMSDPELLDVIK